MNERMNERVRVEREDALVTVVLNRADKHNAMDVPMLRAVIAAQKQVARLQGVRAVLIRGDGPSFCSGLDIKSVLGRPAQVAMTLYPQLWLPWRNIFQRWSMGWRELGVPVLAAVHGNCFGAGLQLALGADLRFCRADAKLSLMESRWGLIPDMGGAALLRELMPIDKAKALTMTGRILDGSQALACGLVSELADDPQAAARHFAEQVASRSPDAIAAGKRLLQRAYDGGEAQALSAERRWQRRLLGSRNQRIAVERGRGKTETPYIDRAPGD